MCSPRRFGEHNSKSTLNWLQRRIQTIEIHVFHKWCMYMQNFESFEFICYEVKRSKKWWENEYIKQLITDLFLWPLDLVANEFETFKVLHIHALLMKYMNFNGLNLLFEANPIYFWNCAHQTLLVRTSHSSFAHILISFSRYILLCV